VRLEGRGSSWVGLVLLVVLGSVGCAGSRAASRTEDSVVEPPATARPLSAPVAPASAAASKPAALPITLRAAHAEPELLSVRHVVAPGETMFRIARAYGVTVEELAAANGIKDVRSLAVGQELLVPTVAPEEDSHSEPDLEPAPGGREPQVVDRGDLPPRPRAPAGSGGPRPGKGVSRPAPATRGMIDWPLRGVLYGRFGKKGKEPHDGIDLAAPSGTPVKTAQEGTVLYAGEQQGYGLIVIVQHPNGIITLYAHNRDLRVTTGQTVRRSQVIATVGESGRTSGPHLHFEVRVDGKPVDPLDYLGPLPAT
jgi:lipoprotein NlpD